MGPHSLTSDDDDDDDEEEEEEERLKKGTAVPKRRLAEFQTPLENHYVKTKDEEMIKITKKYAHLQ